MTGARGPQAADTDLDSLYRGPSLSSHTFQEVLDEEEYIPEDYINDVAEPINDKYVAPTLQNLSKLYWAIGKMDIGDNQAINSFLRINECELYQKFFHSDFEWKKIQAAARDHILKNMSTFPTTFEIMIPIRLGRYDFGTEKFEVDDRKLEAGLRSFEYGTKNMVYEKICDKKGEIPDYPSNMIVILNTPLVLQNFPVSKELARLFIDETWKEGEKKNPNFRVKYYERSAYLRVKIKVTQYKETVRVVRGEIRAVVLAELQGYQIFADPDKLKVLYSKKVGRRRFRRLRPPSDSAQIEEQPVAEQGAQEEDSAAMEEAGSADHAP